VDALPWSAQEYLVTTTKDACVSLYIYSTEIHRFIPVFKSRHPNNIQLMRRVPSALLEWPHKPSEIWDLRDERRLYTFPGPLQLPYKAHGHAVSKDGTRVPYTYVSSVASPKQLIVQAYGAYGISGHRSYPVHWLPWLQKGYGLVVAFPRGGRENGDAWYKGGSTAKNKHNTFEDVYAVIRHVQKTQHIDSRATMFYGRSAGGWVAARVAQHIPPIVGAVYAEVPYVDVLRTTSNPKLPLTELEYTEFGDPVHKEADYEALQRISPMETIPMAPRNAPFVLVRTAFYDVQVLPYESVKYVTKLQASGFHALLGYDKHGGHFAEEDDAVKQQAEDAVLLHYALSSKGPKHTRKRRSSNRRTRRRANS
jgi:oligopeptidase B